MNKLTKYTIEISGILLITGLIGVFNREKLYSPIIFFIAINTILIWLVFLHIQKRNCNWLLGLYLIGVVLIYDLINYEPAWGFESIFMIDSEYWTFTLRTILTIALLILGVYQIIKGEKRKLSIKRIDIQITLLLILGLLIIEAPVYNIHGDFGGNPHGHSLINGFHFH